MMISERFPRYTEYDPVVPVWRVSPDSGGCFHRFFDTSPISPSGRFLGLTRYLPEDGMPRPGDPADIVVVDLLHGDEHVVAKSYGWDTQLGAQVQWGRDDTELFFNDMDVTGWRPFGVCMNPATGEKKPLEGTIYMVSPDGHYAISPCLKRTGCTQAGYGVLVPEDEVPQNHGAPEDDGVYITDTRTGKCRMLVSYAEIVRQVIGSDHAELGDFYGFHVKWNLQGTAVMLVLRRVPHDGSKIQPAVITMSVSGQDLHVAIPSSEWAVKGGHHPNWHPDGKRVMMNLRIDSDEMRFVEALADGRQYRKMSDTIIGSGHPSLHPDGRHVITDCYQHGPMAFADGTTPIRWCDLRTGKVTDIVRIQTRPDFSGPKKVRRVDPHPAWDRNFRRVTFNGIEDGRRHVFIADCSALLDDGS